MLALSPQAFLDIAYKHPGWFTGPLLAGVIVQALAGGIVMGQSLRFWARSTESLSVKAIVAVVSVFAACHFGISSYNVWRITVVDFGNAHAVFAVRWPGVICALMTGLTAVPVQAFFIWRCFKAMRRSWCLLMALVLLLLSTILANVWSNIESLRLNVTVSSQTSGNILPVVISKLSVIEGDRTNKYGLTVISSYFLSAALDLILTGLMMSFLVDIKSQLKTPTHHAKKIILHFMWTLWDSAALPSLCATISCILFIAMSNHNWWALFGQSTLGVLYVMSLLATLNAREEAKRIALANAPVSFLSPLSLPTIRIDESVAQNDGEAHSQTPSVEEVKTGPAGQDETSSSRNEKPRDETAWVDQAIP